MRLGLGEVGGVDLGLVVAGGGEGARVVEWEEACWEGEE